MAKSKEGSRITAKELKEKFVTNIQGNVLRVYWRADGRLILQTQISTRCDPVITNDFSVSLMRLIRHYMLDVADDLMKK